MVCLRCDRLLIQFQWDGFVITRAVGEEVGMRGGVQMTFAVSRAWVK